MQADPNYRPIGAPAQPETVTPPKPEEVPEGAWICPACGAAATGLFCHECGAPRPKDDAEKPV